MVSSVELPTFEDNIEREREKEVEHSMTTLIASIAARSNVSRRRIVDITIFLKDPCIFLWLIA